MPSTFLRRAVKGLHGLFDNKRTQNVFSILTAKSNRYRPPLANDGTGLARPEPRRTPKFGPIFEAARGMSAINRVPNPCATPLTAFVARQYIRQPSVAKNESFGAVGGTRTQNVFSTLTAVSERYRPPVANDGFVATRRFSGLARPDSPNTTKAGPTFEAVRRMSAINCEQKPRVAINGFGKMGRCLIRLAIENNVNVVAINERYACLEVMGNVIRRDLFLGEYHGEVKIHKNNLRVNGKLIKICSEVNPEKIKWEEMRVDYVIETTKELSDIAVASKHLGPGGAKKVIIAKQSKDVPRFFKDVNYSDYKKTMSVVSTGSPTANCVMSLHNVMKKNFGICSYKVVTSPYFRKPKIYVIDVPHHIDETKPDYNREYEKKVRRASMRDILAIPDPDHRIHTTIGYLEFYFNLKSNASLGEVKFLIRENSARYNDNVITCYDSPNEPDLLNFMTSRHSAIVDMNNISADGTVVKIGSWYNKFTGVASRTLDLLKHMIKVDNNH